MATTPNFVGTPRHWTGRITAANTARDGTGTIVDIVPVHATLGRKIERIEITAEVATLAGTVVLYVHDGTNFRIWREVAVTAITPNATGTASFSAQIDLSAPSQLMVLEAGQRLGAAPTQANAFNVRAIGGEF
jgi:ABC-type enterobactin transport system permease subunit